MATVTAAEFNQRPSQVKRAAEAEPVVITQHGRPSFVLLTYAEYQRLLRAPGDLSQWLEMDEEVDFDIDPIGLEILSASL